MKVHIYNFLLSISTKLFLQLSVEANLLHMKKNCVENLIFVILGGYFHFMRALEQIPRTKRFILSSCEM